MKVMTEENRSIVSASTLQELISSLSTFPFMKSHLSFNQILPCYTLRLFGCIHRFLCPDVFNKRDTKGYDRKYKMRIKREPEKSRSTNGWTSNSLITCQDCKIVIIDDQTDEPKKSPTTHELPYDSLSSFSLTINS